MQIYAEPLRQLHDHPNPKVQSWARQTLIQIEAMIEEARIRDAEYDARLED